MKRVLVTGGSGFIGRSVVQRLAGGGAVVTNLDLREPPVGLPGAYVAGDIRGPLRVDGDFDTIVHLAALSKEPGHDFADYFSTNLEGTRNVLELASEKNVSNFLFASSMMVFAPSEAPRRVNDTVCPDTAYGTSKALAEELVASWGAQAPGRRTSVLRLAAVFGPGDEGNFENLRSLLRRGFFVFPGRTDTVKSCIYIVDVVRFVELLVARPADGTFHVCIAPPPTIKQVVEELSSGFGYAPRSVTVPFKPLRGLARFATKLGPVGHRIRITPRRVEKLYCSTNMLQDFGHTDFQLEYGTLRAAVEHWARSSDFVDRRVPDSSEKLVHGPLRGL